MRNCRERKRSRDFRGPVIATNSRVKQERREIQRALAACSPEYRHDRDHGANESQSRPTPPSSGALIFLLAPNRIVPQDKNMCDGMEILQRLANSPLLLESRGTSVLNAAAVDLVVPSWALPK